MNHTYEMYKMKPLFNYPTSTEFPDGVYEIDSIYKVPAMQTGNIDGDKISDLSSHADLASLEHRQEHLLSQLENLSSKLQHIQQQISHVPSAGTMNSNVDPVAASSSLPKNELHDYGDVVITASPNYQPFGLLVMTKWLQERFKVLTLCHVHSSLVSLQENKRSLFQNAITEECRRDQQELLITLIWKEVGVDPWLMISPTKQSAISGDINIIRYLASILSPYRSFSDSADQTLVDSWLDLAHHSVQHGNSKERQAVLRTLNSHLGKNPFLVRGMLSVADVCVLSALLQTESATELPVNIKRWIKSCCEDRSISESFDALSIKLV